MPSSTRPDGATLLHVGRHLVHDGSAQAFRTLAAKGLTVRRPDRTFATADHYVATTAANGARGLHDIDGAGTARHGRRPVGHTPMPTASRCSASTTRGRASCTSSGRSRASPSPAC